SAAELNAIKVRRDAYRYAQSKLMDLPTDLQPQDWFYSCEAARRFKVFTNKLVQVGEMGWIREELQRQSLSEEQAAALYRARKTQ
ncbi:MAG: hypothetical protein ACRCV9_15695, partial [Burkholderiaceae bacterium]